MNLTRPLTVKELAAALGVSRWYVWAMRREGFPRRRALLAEAVEWVKNHPDFRVRPPPQHSSPFLNIPQHL